MGGFFILSVMVTVSVDPDGIRAKGGFSLKADDSKMGKEDLPSDEDRDHPTHYPSLALQAIAILVADDDGKQRKQGCHKANQGVGVQDVCL